MEDNSDNIYKLNTNRSPLRSEIRNDLEHNMQKFSDPVVLGELVYKLVEERENTNRILKNILAKLESIRGTGTAVAAPGGEPLLPEVDENIMEFARARGKISAEDVRQQFNYKGKNAACARLNRLYELNLLGKKQVGKKVFFFPL